MLLPNNVYTAIVILEQTEINTAEPSFWQKDITIGGIKVKGPNHEIALREDQEIIIKIGDKIVKAPVYNEEILPEDS